MKNVLVTGGAGFIGSNLVDKLILENFNVTVLDNLSTGKKEYVNPKAKFVLVDLSSHRDTYIEHFKGIDTVYHVAALPRVEPSIKDPVGSNEVNVTAALNVFDAARVTGVKRIVFSSSSSVYGGNDKSPFSVMDRVDNPISLYAATKKSNELMAHVYSHLFDLRTTGLRFFTVYGPYGRPDMALFIFTNAIRQGRAIEVYNYGKMERDFTYVDDIVQGVLASLDNPFKYEVFNLGNNRPIQLTYFIDLIEEYLGKRSERILMPLQSGDVLRTCADIEHSKEKLGYDPKIPIEVGVKKFIDWHMDHYPDI